MVPAIADGGIIIVSAPNDNYGSQESLINGKSSEEIERIASASGKPATRSGP